MGLQEYKRKRNFRRTAEPAPKKIAKAGDTFVVQKHDASHLHYDFRLELDGVLKSWAVPKGPSLDPTVKRLAVQVEDHPVEYGGFEGTIPAGEYGGGTVLLWDRGRWEPQGDPHAGFRDGKLKFKLFGEKLHGGWTLVRTRAGRGKDEGRQWLLIKERDNDAQSAADGDVLEAAPRSVKTNRDLEEIAAGKKAQRKSRKSTPPAKRAAAASARQTSAEHFAPQLAVLVDKAPDSDEWLHEIKYDGYRILCHLRNGRVRLTTRNELDWTARLPELAAAIAKLKADEAVLDGELVAMNADGVTDFGALQAALSEQQTEKLRYYAFDLLALDGDNLRDEPLEARKKRLEKLLRGARRGPLRYSEHVLGNGPAFLAEAAKLGLEGIVSKLRDSASVPGRGGSWLKAKCLQREEFVIGGYTDPSGSRQGFGALLIGYHRGDKGLRYAGKVGTGFDAKLLRDLEARLQSQTIASSPFADLTTGGRGVHWVRPTLVAQIAFSNWTRDGRLRHPAFLGLREDKSAAEVVQSPRGGKNTPRKKAAASRTKSPPGEVGGVRLTHPDKVLYPDDGITKADLANYYAAVADWMLPHVANRPLVLVRCPDGRDGTCFYQKHAGPGTPAKLQQIRIREKERNDPYVYVKNAEGLIALTQISALEIHQWGSRVDDIERPDRLVFDLDPDEAVPWPTVVRSAFDLRDLLAEIGLESFLKTTGGKGLHLVVPLRRGPSWDEAKEFAKQVADCFVQANPDLYLAKMSKAARRGKIFIDYLRNDRGSTSVAPFSTRAKPGAPVSLPIAWKELTAKRHSDDFNLKNAPQRLAKRTTDPWARIDRVRQGLSHAVVERLLRWLERAGGKSRR